MQNQKKKLIMLLESNDCATASQAVVQDPKAVSLLIRLSYNKDTLVGWRAILAVGIAARAMVSKDALFLRETCRKLLWSLSDESGGIGWSAPELIGEIVSADPKLFMDVIPLVASVYEVEEDVFRPGILYALARIAEKAPEPVAQFQKVIMLSLADKEPLVRLRGLQLVRTLWPWIRTSNCWSKEYRDRIAQVVSALIEDKGEAWVYMDDGFQSILVGDEANSLDKLVC